MRHQHLQIGERRSRSRASASSTASGMRVHRVLEHLLARSSRDSGAPSASADSAASRGCVLRRRELAPQILGVRRRRRAGASTRCTSARRRRRRRAPPRPRRRRRSPSRRARGRRCRARSSAPRRRPPARDRTCPVVMNCVGDRQPVDEAGALLPDVERRRSRGQPELALQEARRCRGSRDRATAWRRPPAGCPSAATPASASARLRGLDARSDEPMPEPAAHPAPLADAGALDGSTRRRCPSTARRSSLVTTRSGT